MYFPYVRGRQYELLALRELVEKDKLGSNIIPIVEPVKLSSTLLKTIDVFVSKNRPMAIICNPKVGSFSTDMKDKSAEDNNQQKFLKQIKNKNIIKTHIIKNNSVHQLEIWEKFMNIPKNEWIIINNNREFQFEYDRLFDHEPPRFVLIPDESSFRRQVRHNRVLLTDRFNKCNRNSDYAKQEDEFYSDDHLYYKTDGFVGFADYSIIGKDYLESGFAPYAVAIHIVYFDENNKLRVHHFVSDTNDDTSNTAGKFYEAVQKLTEWVEEKQILQTESLRTFIEYYKNQTYPGLGSVKKLSLMHHLELIANFLNEEN